MDPLLKGLGERQQSFRRTVISLAAELKDARTRLASQQKSLATETQARQEIEIQAKGMEEKILQLQNDLEHSNQQLQLSTAAIDQGGRHQKGSEGCLSARGCGEVSQTSFVKWLIFSSFNKVNAIYPLKELDVEKIKDYRAKKMAQYVKELDDLRSQLSATRATGDINAALAQSVQRQCLALLNDIDEKDSVLKENEDRVNWLEVQLAHLRKDLEERENSPKQLIDDVYVSEQMITQDSCKASFVNNFELGKILKEVSPRSVEKINRHLAAKDEEIATLRESIRIMSGRWKLKYKDMELQLQKHQRTDQELKKMILKLEYCLQEAHSQIRKLQWMGEKKEKAIKELKEQMVINQQGRLEGSYKQNFWESSGFKILISISLLILVVFSKR